MITCMLTFYFMYRGYISGGGILGGAIFAFWVICFPLGIRPNLYTRSLHTPLNPYIAREQIQKKSILHIIDTNCALMLIHTAYCMNTGELSDLEKQLNEGGLSAHELEKAKKRLEQEKEELTQSLEARNCK